MGTLRAMSDDRSDPLGDVINLLAAPIAGGLRSLEQAKRGIDELFRAVENVNRTMENLNEAAERINRFMADVEEPVRVLLPQLARTVRAADDLMDAVGGPARRVAPNIGRIVETLGSPTFTSLPTQLNEFMGVMAEMSRRLGPLAQFAESAGGMFGLRFPSLATRPEPPAAAPAPAPSVPAAAPARSTTARSTTAARQPAKKASSTTTAKRSSTTARSSSAKRASAAKRSAG
jgi:ABC-type transporter Mla subunit MlaD